MERNHTVEHSLWTRLTGYQGRRRVVRNLRIALATVLFILPLIMLGLAVRAAIVSNGTEIFLYLVGGLAMMVAGTLVAPRAYS
ncbi:MAG: hypothetical protein PVJ40_10275 [Gammaproteobacteria bacterium]|jgi:hypothetical protein